MQEFGSSSAMDASLSFTIRTMNRAELELALEWAADEGWNPGLHDAQCFQAADPQGFLIGYLNEEPVGCISVVAYDDKFGFLGLYIVRPPFRGQGYGLKLWQAGMTYMNGRNVGLDGVVAQQENYRKSGFRLAYRNIRYEGVGQPAVPADAADAGELIDLSAVPFDTVFAYDSALFPVPRPRFLRAWLAQPQAAGFAAMRDGRMAGYGLLRPCRRGCKIGPLFADTADIAEDLLRALAAQAGDTPLFLDVPEPNAAASLLAERHGMNKVFETARMYTGQFPAVAPDRIFGVTTFELG
jgi:ribosomal protein S18 acetylase RimI-like enzyme